MRSNETALRNIVAHADARSVSPGITCEGVLHPGSFRDEGRLPLRMMTEERRHLSRIIFLLLTKLPEINR